MTACPPIEQILCDLNWCCTSTPIAGSKPGVCRQPDAPMAARVQQLWRERKSHRLGHYYELLWAALMQPASATSPLLCDFQLNLGGRTLGALDFLRWDEQSGRYTHLEVAIKFYLLTGDASDSFAWVGPNAVDKLGRKLHYMQHHQSRLLFQPGAMALVNDHLAKQRAPLLSPHNLSTQMLMQGWLFTTYEYNNNQLALGDKRHRGHWLRHSQFLSQLVAQQIPAPIYWLPKHYWIGACQWKHVSFNREAENLPSQPVALDVKNLEAWLGRFPGSHMVQAGSLRLLIVPDHWPQAEA